MSKRKIYTVKYDKDSEKWKGQAAGNERASTTGETKKEVVDRMKEIAKNEGNSQLRIYKQERTYGNDPYPPKG
jgi:uncharacterized Fe-S cluster-containing radical SAM superfamily protein